MLWTNSQSGNTLFKTMCYEWIIDNIQDTKAQTFVTHVARATVGFNKLRYGVSMDKYPTKNMSRSRKLFREWEELGYIRYFKGSNIDGTHGKRPPMFELGNWVYEVRTKCEDIVSGNSNKIIRVRASNSIKDTVQKEDNGKEIPSGF